MQQILDHCFIYTFWWRKSKLLFKIGSQVYIFPPDNVWLVTRGIFQPASYDSMLYINGIISGLLIKVSGKLLPLVDIFLNAVLPNHITTLFVIFLLHNVPPFLP